MCIHTRAGAQLCLSHAVSRCPIIVDLKISVCVLLGVVSVVECLYIKCLLDKNGKTNFDKQIAKTMFDIFV